MLLITDHFEPPINPGPAASTEVVRDWCRRFAEVSRGRTDSSGRNPKYTWFYRYDNLNSDNLQALSYYAFQGLGEIEFHLHHGFDTSDTFTAKIQEGVSWFNSFGAMISAESTPRKAFGYIAGDWALDNGRGRDQYSGVNNELQILGHADCYADFTFPAFGEESQPRLVNSIYYAKDSGNAKSYDSGTMASVGVTVHDADLMLFQGPLFVDWRAGEVEYGGLEAHTPFSAERVDRWINAGVRVASRPEWLFVKLHTHGVQFSESLLGRDLPAMYGSLPGLLEERGIRLHYVTAREAINVVRAAEAGETGDPVEFFDYEYKPPANLKLHVNRPFALEEYSGDRIRVSFPEPQPDTQVCLREGGIAEVTLDRAPQLTITRRNDGNDEVEVTAGVVNDVVYRTTNRSASDGTDGQSQ